MGLRGRGAGFTVLALLAAPAALAQSGNACDQLKAKLAASIEATGVRGYSLEAVPASEPVPKDGRVIGNCEAGAFKMVYRRFGGAAAAAAAPAVEKPVATVTPAPSPSPKPTPTPPPTTSPTPKPTPTPSPSPTPAPKPSPSPTPTPTPTPSPSPSPSPIPLPSPSPSPVAQVVETPPPAAPAITASSPAAADEDSFVAAHWPWLLLLLVLPGAFWAWSRIAYRLRYDEAGLPRGPRLS